jgi:16S rRNA (adenine1518-N6/adenine1519-N6)-dimethyltransferase
VPREKFTPAPNVDSAVVKIVIEKNKFKSVDYSAVRNLVRIGFQNRRKMLINNIMNGYKLPRDKVEEMLDKTGVNLTARAENLTAEQFVCLAEELKDKGSK